MAVAVAVAYVVSVFAQEELFPADCWLLPVHMPQMRLRKLDTPDQQVQ